MGAETDRRALLGAGALGLSGSLAFTARAAARDVDAAKPFMLHDLVQDGNFRVPVELAGQPREIVTSRLLRAHRTSVTAMHFASVVEVSDGVGAGGVGTDRATVGTYSAVHASAGGGEIFALNTLAGSGRGHTGMVSGLEVNVNVDVGGSTAGNGPSQFLSDPGRKPNCYIACIGNQAKPLAYCLGHNMLGGQGRAYTFLSSHNGTYEGPWADIQCGASHVIRSAGKKTAGIDLSGDSYLSGFGVFLGNAHMVGWKGERDDAPLPRLQGVDGELVLRAKATLSHGKLAPALDDTYSCGTGRLRWSSVKTVNGTESSSDAALKTDIEDLPGEAMAELVMALRPVIYRWREGGMEVVERMEETEVHASVVGPDGVETHLYDEIPVLNEQGCQIVDRVPGRPVINEVRNPVTGEIVNLGRDAVPEMLIPRVRVVPRMERQSTTVEEARSRPGQRRHVGYLFQDVDAALKARGLDLGICVRDADGALSLRHERFIPVLMAAWQHSERDMSGRLMRIEARLAALESAGHNANPGGLSTDGSES